MKPNIVLLFTDQQRYDTVNACGYDYMKTKNIDRLVHEGCNFNNAYSPNPICVPARHNLITGLPAKFHGYAANYTHSLDHRIPTLPSILSKHGYDTRAIGKMHFQPPRSHNGFKKMELMEEIPEFREDDEYAMYLKECGLGSTQNIHGVRNLLYMLPQQSLIPEKHHGSTWVGDRTVEYIRTNGGKRPFFLWSSWIAPHPPFDVPESFANLYKNAEIPPPLTSETLLSKAAEKSKYYCRMPEGKEKEYLRRIKELYYSSISLVDKNIGRVLQALEDTGELDNTFILFASDHGEMLGDYGCFQKMLPYDSASKIPFIIRYPEKFAAGSANNEFTDLNDVLPTILDIAGIKYPGPYELPGASVLKNSKNRKYQYMEFGKEHSRWISLRDKRYKYNYYYAGAYEELFDMVNDPHEKVNLLYSAELNEDIINVKERLRSLLCNYEYKWGLEGYAKPDCLKKVNEVILEPYFNCQYPVFPDNIADDTEKASMNKFGDEVIDAVSKEKIVKLKELDIKSWRKSGAPEEAIQKVLTSG